MSGPGEPAWPVEISGRWPVSRTEELAVGRIARFCRDTVRMPDGHEVSREYFEHPGAVAIVALDESGRVLMIRQYRHPAGWQLWELPAGLRDVAGEPPLLTAQRELAEETGYQAANWRELVDFFCSPGISGERITVYLATAVSPIAGHEASHQRVDEEAHLLIEWVPLSEVVSAFLAGELRNGVMALGVLTAYAATLAEPGVPR